LEQRKQLIEDLLDALLVGRIALDDQLVALGADAHVEERLEMLEVRIAGAVEGLQPLLGQRQLLHRSEPPGAGRRAPCSPLARNLTAGAAPATAARPPGTARPTSGRRRPPSSGTE